MRKMVSENIYEAGFAAVRAHLTGETAMEARA
jgi:hypothetical protein